MFYNVIVRATESGRSITNQTLNFKPDLHLPQNEKPEIHQIGVFGRLGSVSIDVRNPIWFRFCE